jgi:hypothetical protein
LASGNAVIVLTDITGREVMQSNRAIAPGVNKIKLDVSSLNPGVYVVRTLVDNKINVTKLMIH